MRVTIEFDDYPIEAALLRRDYRGKMSRRLKAQIARAIFDYASPLIIDQATAAVLAERKTIRRQTKIR